MRLGRIRARRRRTRRRRCRRLTRARSSDVTGMLISREQFADGPAALGRFRLYRSSVVQAEWHVLPELESLRQHPIARPVGRARDVLLGNRASFSARRRSSSARSASGRDCADAQAPSRDMRGRVAKYASASASGLLDPPSMRTCRPSGFQWNSRRRAGWPPVPRPCGSPCWCRTRSRADRPPSAARCGPRACHPACSRQRHRVGSSARSRSPRPSRRGTWQTGR